MLLTTITGSAWIAAAIYATAVSVAYSIQQAKKMRKAARDAAEARKGFEVVTAGDTQPIPIVYGRAKIGGTRVWHNTKSSHTAPPTSNADKVFNAGSPAKTGYTITWETEAGSYSTVLGDEPSSSLSNSQSGAKNEFLYYEQVLCHGPINKVVDLVIDESRFLNDPEFAKAGSNAAFRTELHYDGSVANNMISYNFPDRISAKFPGLAYAATAIRLNRDDPQFSGQVPSVQYFIEGRKVRKITRTGTAGNYTYNFNYIDRQYSNNPVWCLLDYLLDANRLHTNGAKLFDSGKSLSLDDIDLESFYNASLICDTIVLNNKPVYGNVWKSIDLTTNILTRNIPLYECNTIIDVEKPIRENIEALLSTMGDARLVWSEGKYKLSLQYPSSNANIKLAATLTDDDLVLGKEIQMTWPSSSDRLNFATVKFHNEAENFKEDSVSWPPKASGTFYRGVGGVRYPTSDGSAGGGIGATYAVWSGSENTATLNWKFRAVVSGTHTITLQIDDYGWLKVFDQNDTLIATVSAAGNKNMYTGLVTLNAGAIYTITAYGVDTGGAKCIAATLAQDNFIYWTTKEPAYTGYETIVQTSAVYDAMKAEDNGLELETSVFLEGCTDYYHALAKAEELVRTSRSASAVKFSYIVKNNFLEPGDIVKLNTTYLPAGTELYVRVNEVSLNENAICDISGTRFDYTQLAWNVSDSDYTKPAELFNFEVPVPRALIFTPSEEILKNSSGKLSWDSVEFDGFASYILYMATVNDVDSNGKLVFNELGRTQATYYVLPPIKEKSAVFGIRVISKSNRLSQIVTTGDTAVLLRAAPTPPLIENFSVVSSATEPKITLSWSKPLLRTDGSVYDDHLGTVIYRSVGSSSFANAVYIGESLADTFYDTNEVYNQTYYWARFLSTYGQFGEYSFAGPFDFTHTTPGSDPRTPRPSTGLVAIVNGSIIILNWSLPTTWPDNSQYLSHGSTLIYAAQKTSAVIPTFNDAALVDSTKFSTYSFVASPGETWYFWIKEVSASGVSSTEVGPVNATAVLNIQATLDALSNQLDESKLTQSLRDRISIIDDPVSGLEKSVQDLSAVYGTTASAAQSAFNAANSASQAALSLANTLTSNAGVSAMRDEVVLARADAQTSKSDAQLYAAGAAQSATTASGAAASASTSATLAAQSAFDAATSASSAITASQTAASYSDAAQVASTAATNSSISASASKDLAQASASSAVTNAASSSASATSASQSAIAADADAVIAITKAGEALASANSAATSEYNAAQSSLAASSFKDLTVTSALEALSSASAASTYADNASISMSSALTAADSASVSKVAAESARDSAISSASSAAISASVASAASTDASSSANSANLSAVSANTSANNAQTYAIQSASSASLAATAQQAALDSATASSIQASNANTYAANALVYSQQSATSASSATGSAASAASYLQQVKSTAVGFYAYADWNFESSAEGWTATNATITQSVGTISTAPSAASTRLISPKISLNGVFAPIVRIRIKRSSGTGWNGILYYVTATHGESVTYQMQSDTTGIGGNYTIVEWDMSSLSDWTSNQISQIILDLGNTLTDTFIIDWISIGSISPPVSLSGNTNIANVGWWAANATLPTGWSYNGEAAEHSFVTDVDYTDRSTILLKAVAGGANTLDGGFSGGDFITAIDRTKAYRFIIPVKLITTSSNIKWKISGVNTINTSTLNTTAYFVNGTVPAGTWYLAVGYVFPEGSTGNVSSSAGLYNPADGSLVLSGTNFCWNASANISYGVSRDTVADGVTCYFGKPIIHLLDGSEPQFESMLFTARTVTASVQTLASTVAGPDGATAQYTIKVDSNGYVAGIGLSSTTNTAGVGTSEFTVVSDKFSIAPVASSNPAWSSTTTYALGATVYYNGRNYTSLQASNLNKTPNSQPTWWSKDNSPFFHLTSAATIDGITVPAGTYMDNAYIINLTADKIKSGTTTIGSGAFGLGGTETLNGYPATGRFQTTSANGFALLGFQDSTTDGNCAIAGVHRSNTGFGLGAYNASTTSYSAFYTTAVFSLGGNSGYGGLMKYNRSVTTDNNLSLLPYSIGVIGSKDNAGLFVWYGETSTYQRTAAYICNAAAMTGAIFKYHPDSTATESKELRICNSDYAAVALSGKGKIYAADGFTPFTGAHDGIISDSAIAQGDILVDFKVLKQLDISNSIVEYKLSSVPNQKGAIGVLNQVHDTPPTDWAEVFANPKGSKDPMVDPSNYQETPEFVSNPDYYPIPALYKVVTVNALGEGQINVCGENGNIEIGDLIVTSSIPGKGMKQSDDIVRSYSVAKARQSVTFNDPSEIKQIACIYIGG